MADKILQPAAIIEDGTVTSILLLEEVQLEDTQQVLAPAEVVWCGTEVTAGWTYADGEFAAPK